MRLKENKKELNIRISFVISRKNNGKLNKIVNRKLKSAVNVRQLNWIPIWKMM